MKCPYPRCSKEIDETKLVKEWHKLGRQAKCPECKKLILFTRQASGLVRDKSGKLIKQKIRTKINAG